MCSSDLVAALKDLNLREFVILGVLAVLVLVMGIWPQPFVDVLHTSVNDILSHVTSSKIPQ